MDTIREFSKTVLTIMPLVFFVLANVNLWASNYQTKYGSIDRATELRHDAYSTFFLAICFWLIVIYSKICDLYELAAQRK